MTIASLPTILYLLPLFTIITAIVPGQWKPLSLSIGGLTVVLCLGGFPSMLLMMFSVCSAWLVLRVQPPRSGEHRHRAGFWFCAGVLLQFFWLLLGKLLLGSIQTIPLLICTLQSIECLHARADRRIHIPGLYLFFCYQCDMTRLFAGPVLSFSEYEACRAGRKVTAERLGEGASLCIRGIFQLVCLSLPMQALHAQLVPGTVVRTVFDAVLALAAFFFAVYYALKGAAQLGQGIAAMLGFAYPDSFDAPIAALSLRDFWKRFMISIHDWADRVLLHDLSENDPGAYFVRTAILLGGIGLLVRSGGGMLWGVFMALLLTAERRLSPAYGSRLPSPAKRLLTAFLLLFSLGFAGNSITGSFSFYGALFGFGGVAFSETAGYLMRTSWLAGFFCIAGLFPFRRMTENLSNTYLRFVRAVCRAAAEISMLLLAYAELLSQYIRN